MTWVGLTLVKGRRIARVIRAHGNWLAIAYDRSMQPSSGEYFSYGQPGSLVAAKHWCEARLRKPAPRKGRRK